MTPALKSECAEAGKPASGFWLLGNVPCPASQLAAGPHTKKIRELLMTI